MNPFFEILEEDNLDNNYYQLDDITLDKYKLLALSIHGMFECLALGIQVNFNNTLFLFIALMIHKWAEAFALGIFFVQARLIKKHYYPQSNLQHGL